MIGKQRFGKKTKTKRLVIRNKFQNPPLNRSLFTAYRAPLRRDGMSSLEEAAKQNSLVMIGDEAYEGLLGEKPGLDLSRYGNALITLDDGVSSVEQAEKERSAMRQAERYNAGILTAKEKMLKTLYKQEKKRKEMAAREKIIQYLSLYDEEDKEQLSNIPMELREEVTKYKQRMADIHGRYSRTTGENIPTIAEKREYDEFEKMQKAYRAMREAEKKKKPEEKYTASAQAFQDMRKTGFGIINNPHRLQGIPNRVFGWKAPRIHELLTPLRRTLQSQLSKTPEQIVDEHKKEREERETEYKEQQTQQRGVEPPKEMVNRAVPKTAEPAFIPSKYLDSDHLDLDVIPHPFVLRKRKYQFMPVPTLKYLKRRLYH